MRYSIFGESHGPAIGVVLEGVPSGLALDMDFIAGELARRAPGRSTVSTERKEKDIPEILSGVFEGRTTGTPLCAVIRNTDCHSGDYEATRHLARPGHGDYSGHVRYKGFNDYRGGGHFSGRLTAPLVFAGAVAKLILAQKGIYIGAHIRSVGTVSELSFVDIMPDLEMLAQCAKQPFPALEKGEEMQAEILSAKAEGDSIGGTIECAILGLSAGLGQPDLDGNLEGILARHIFAVPAVKGLEFGVGFDCARMWGSEYNDRFYMDGDQVRTHTNHAGGINGGITNGMPVIFTVAMRPTPSIAKAQGTIDMARREDAVLELKGRHDPCVVHRAVPVIEAAAALAVCELLEGVSGLD